MTVSVSNCPHFLDNLRICHGFSFHGLLRSGTEFRLHLPVVLRYTISFTGRVLGEQWGGAAEILSRLGVEHGN
jgi:hypothetical protein